MADAVDVVCVGGGAVGLALAYELAKRSLRIAVVDRGALGKESSWAGAGILSPSPKTPVSDDDHLRAFSYEAFPRLAEELLDKTGVDVGFRETGGVELALSPREADELSSHSDAWQMEEVACENLSPESLRRLEPRLRYATCAAVYVPSIRQVRNPWYVRGLEQACRLLGVELSPHREAKEVLFEADAASGVLLADGDQIHARHVVVTAGAWASQFLEQAGISIPIYPVRGQMAAYQTSGHVVRHIVEAGKRYLVPRDDGLVLVGSTEEEVGFDRSTTEQGLEQLHRFAVDLFPDLDSCHVAASWAGLRPACRLGYPIIGRSPDKENLWIAAGHFRQGIQLSPGTARLLADWLTGVSSFAAEDAFSPARRTKPFQSSFHS